MQPEDQRDHKARYMLIPRVLLFLQHDQSLLMLKGAADKRLWAGKYNGIGGHVEAGESPWQAAQRELREESGLTAEQLHLRALVTIDMPEPPGILLFVYTGTAKQGTLRDSEEGKPEWISLDALYDLPLVDDLYTLLPRILASDGLTYARYRFDDQGLHIDFDDDKEVNNV